MTTTSDLLAARIFLRRRFPHGGRVLCAVSGGLDSMCLLHFLSRQRGFTAAAAHFNHRLRPAAQRDEDFVRDWCRREGIPFFRGEGDVSALAEAEGLSVEEAGRKARYAFLEETARANGYAAVLTAHHADDNAETMLLNLVRGTGTAGLAGIPPVRGIICRPFLRLSRETLASYAAEHHIPHVEDETNADPDAAGRNLLRLEVMPLLRRLNPRAVENMSFTAEVLRRENRAMEDLAARLAEASRRDAETAAIPRAALLEVPLPVAERVVLRLLAEAAGQRKDLAAAHVEAVMDLAERGRGQVSLPYGLTAEVRGKELEIRRNRRLPPPAALTPGRPLRWGDYTLTLLDRREGEGLALRPGEEPVTVIPCPAGARLTLPGSSGSRTVKRLCMDRRIPPGEREGLPALRVGGRLAAVWGLGVNQTFLPEGEPCRFIQIKKETEESRHEQ